MNYHKNDLLDECLDRFYCTFSHTLDTSDYVPQAFNDKILKYIFKCMRKKFRELDIEDRQYQKAQRREERMRAKISSSSEALASDEESEQEESGVNDESQNMAE